MALIGGLIVYRTRTRIKRMLGSFLRVRTAESSPEMRISAKSVVIEPTKDLSEWTSQYSTGLQSQPSSGLRRRHRADHNLVKRLGSEYQTGLQLWQESTADAGEAEFQETTAVADDAEWQESAADAGDAELQETTADAGDTEWQEDTADAGEAEWQKFNLLSLDEGGIRGYWSLLALQSLMEFIGNEEEKEEIYHSFYPVPFTDEDHSEEALRKIRRTQRYLPCHYFDYICGSGCGALIAIMLGRFRMTVPDCLSEYVKLGHEVFGKPRMVSTMRFGFSPRAKYNDKRLEEIVQDVIKRRNGEPRKHLFEEKVVIQSGRALCATIVTTTKLDADTRRSLPYLIRSYDYERRHSFDEFTRSTRKTAMRPDRTNTGISGNTNVLQERREPEMRNPVSSHDDYKAQLLEVWQVARAATARKFYFEPMKIEDAQGAGSMRFTDGPFGSFNNPTRTGIQEIAHLHGYSSLGTVVSVGTACTLKTNAKKSFVFSIPGAARELGELFRDSQQVHEQILKNVIMHEEHQYFRLDYAEGLKTEVDEWEPKGNLNSNKKAGSKTISDMENAFSEWMAKVETQDQFRDCAAALVARRRERMATRKWERYATGSSFKCRLRGCDTEDFLDREDFLCHLSEFHGLEGGELHDEARATRRQWQYQAAAPET